MLEWLCKQLIKLNKMEPMLKFHDGLYARWELKIPVDITKIYETATGKMIRNRTLRKFIDSLGLYEWISIELKNKTLEVIDDAICWGFEEKEASRIMTVEKNKEGRYIYHDEED